MVLLLIRGDLRRCQAEIPLIPLFRFAEPAFRSWVAMRLSRHWLRSTPISRVQRARPSGGLEQTVATSRASSLPESLRLAPVTERGLQVADDKAALGPVHGRAAHADAGCDLLVTGARVGSQQNLRALELGRRMFAPAQKRRECAALANEQGSSSDSRALPAASKCSLIRSTCQSYCQSYHDPRFNRSKPLCRSTRATSCDLKRPSRICAGRLSSTANLPFPYAVTAVGNDNMKLIALPRHVYQYVPCLPKAIPDWLRQLWFLSQAAASLRPVSPSL